MVCCFLPMSVADERELPNSLVTLRPVVDLLKLGDPPIDAAAKSSARFDVCPSALLDPAAMPRASRSPTNAMFTLTSFRKKMSEPFALDGFGSAQHEPRIEIRSASTFGMLSYVLGWAASHKFFHHFSLISNERVSQPMYERKLAGIGFSAGVYRVTRS